MSFRLNVQDPLILLTGPSGPGDYALATFTVDKLSGGPVGPGDQKK